MRHDFLKNWLILFGLQAVLASLIFRDFLTGSLYFAYLDIGTDTYEGLSAYAMHMARLFSREGWPGWSFEIGLGAPIAWMLGDTFLVLTQLAGPDHVLELRIWVHLLKIAMAGTFFLMLARNWVTRGEAAVVAALAYSFCGYAVVNGQWDGEANVYVFFPLVLAAIVRQLRQGGVIFLPLAVAVTLLSGVFFFTFGVSLMVACAAFVAMSGAPRMMLRTWFLRIVPLILLGYLIASPYLLPYVIQLLDNPRVTGAQAMMSTLWEQGLMPSSLPLLLVQLGGLFHKDIFGVGNAYAGYMNYLEGPGFYIGMLPLLAIAQLWRAPGADHRALIVGLCGVALYFLFPLFRLSAIGFSAPYFRSSSIWVTLALMLLAMRGIDQILVNGVSWKRLAGGSAIIGATLALVIWQTGPQVWMVHAVKIIVLLTVCTAVLALAAASASVRKSLPLIALLLMSVEVVTIAWPSYFAGRRIASPSVQPLKDETLDALRVIRERDHSVFRVEKTFDSIGLADSMAQDYMGVKSYYLHGSGIVDFHSSMDLMARFAGGRPNNYTNYMPAPGNRYMVHSALGVKYLIANQPVELPGFEAIHTGPGYTLYRNELALPLGVVQSRQVTRAAMSRLSTRPPEQARLFKDIALINAVVVDGLLPDWGTPFDPESLARSDKIDMQSLYVQPALKLQQTGLKLTHFSNERVAGYVQPDVPGILVFSIPFIAGWTLYMDGQQVPLIRANFGMLAAPVPAGRHEVELRYQLPGRRAGFLLGLMGCALVALLHIRSSRARRQPNTNNT